MTETLSEYVRRVRTEKKLSTVDVEARSLHSISDAYVSQIDKVEALRAEQRFADRVRMLHVYGGKVVRPEGVVVFNESLTANLAVDGLLILAGVTLVGRANRSIAPVMPG